MKKIIIGLLIILPFLTFGQSDFCNKNFGESYFPLQIGFEKNITWGGSLYVEKITEKTVVNGTEYFKYVQDFGSGTSYDLLLRNQNDTILMYNEKQKKDIILLIAKPEKGIKWESGKVDNTNGDFETPYCNYKNLLVVEYKYRNGEKETRYYKKGLGLVAVTNRKGIKGICLPNKEEAQSLVQPLTFIGCEKELDKSKIEKCTMSSIQSFIANKLKLETIKAPKENGVLKFNVHISKDGEVSEVETLNSIAGGNPTRKAIKKIIQSLPKFIPTKTADKKSVGTNFKLAVPISAE